jgi:hypothetical protein
MGVHMVCVFRRPGQTIGVSRLAEHTQGAQIRQHLCDLMRCHWGGTVRCQVHLRFISTDSRVCVPAHKALLHRVDDDLGSRADRSPRLVYHPVLHHHLACACTVVAFAHGGGDRWHGHAWACSHGHACGLHASGVHPRAHLEESTTAPGAWSTGGAGCRPGRPGEACRSCAPCPLCATQHRHHCCCCPHSMKGGRQLRVVSGTMMMMMMMTRGQRGCAHAFAHASIAHAAAPPAARLGGVRSSPRRTSEPAWLVA